MDKFHVGTILCPVCNKKNKRYLSEFDLYLYFSVSCLIYTISLQTALLTLDYFLPRSYLWTSVLMILVLVLAYLATTNLAKYIYLHAPFKKSWKNHAFDENRIEVTRSINLQFIIFIFVSFLVGTNENFFDIYLLMLAAIIIINCIKTYFIRKKEIAALPPKSPHK